MNVVWVSLLAGLLVTASVPPFGWWALGPVGLALLVTVLAGRPARYRALAGFVFGVGLYGVSLFWMKAFALPGWLLVVALESTLTALAITAVPPERGRLLAFPAAVVGAEALRSAWPWGGLPLGGIDLGQAGGPLAPVAALGGRLAVVGVAALLGTALAAVVASGRGQEGRRDLRGRRGRWRASALAGAAAALVLAAGWAVPTGESTGELRVAAVQGGGRRGLRATEERAAVVVAAHVAASRRIQGPVELVLWPEDVVDVDRFVDSVEAEAVAGLARRLQATVIVGVVEDAGPTHFFNAAVAVAPRGKVIARYDKVRRVPFGEFFPGRRFIDDFYDLPARDAVAGRGPGVLATPAGDLGVLVSYEVFFADRGRAAARTGAQLLTVPTNAASYSSSQVPTQQMAAARLRAVETGRDLVQAGPTGYSALIDAKGTIHQRSVLGARQVIEGVVSLRTGHTPFTRAGPRPVVGAAVATLAMAWWLARRFRRRTSGNL